MPFSSETSALHWFANNGSHHKRKGSTCCFLFLFSHLSLLAISILRSETLSCLDKYRRVAITTLIKFVHCLDKIVMYDSPNCDVVLTILFYKLDDFGDQTRRLCSPNSSSLVFSLLRTGLQNFQ